MPPLPDAAPEAPARRAPSLLRAAGLIAVITVLAKLLGALRDWQIFQAYGASITSDAYFAAVQIPSFAIVLLGGLGGPFHTAIVGVFSRLIDAGERPSTLARQLASTVLTLTGGAFSLLSILVFFYAEPLLRALLPGGDPAMIAMAATHLRIMAPVMLLGGVIGVFYGLVNVYHSYVWPSLSPAALNVAMILALIAFPEDPAHANGNLLAWATLAGAVFQVALQLPDFLRFGFTLKPSLAAWRSIELRQIGEVLFPMMIGVTIGQLMTYVDMLFAARLAEGGWSAVVLSNRLLQLPIGVLQTAFLVPVFPRFSRAVADQRWDDLRRDFRMGVVSLWFISLPILTLLLLLSEPAIRVAFQHGRFDAGDTRLVTLALVFQAFQMLPYFARDTLTRVFYAFQDSVTPMLVGFLAIGVKYLLNAALVSHYGIGGITLSTTLITLLNMTVLAIALKGRHGVTLGVAAMARSFGKLAIAAGVTGLALWALTDPLTRFLIARGLQGAGADLTLMAVVSLAGAALYLALTWALRVPEADALFARVGLRRNRLNDA
ncbi:MAG: murein biosynthesis integral membrane protein MurJ [Vampirovibrionales bacterium]|nr:murein biosynthesis integral membrane protein MurJ [Vampirovibrionales bacterium]